MKERFFVTVDIKKSVLFRQALISDLEKFNFRTEFFNYRKALLKNQASCTTNGVKKYFKLDTA